MLQGDFGLVMGWWATLFIFGIVGLPLARIVFSEWDSRGYVFAKVFGLIGTGYLAWVLGTMHILPFSRVNIGVCAGLFLALGLFIQSRVRRVGKYQPHMIRLMVFEELLFFAALLLWVWVRGHAPDVHDLEKFMDFGFAKSIWRAEYFPPQDIWFARLPINYYYFGHLLMAMLSKFANIDLIYGFNLMLASLFAFCFTLSFAVARRLLAKLKPVYIVIGGLFTAYLLTMGGNLHTIYLFTQGYKFDEPNPPPFWTMMINPFDAEARRNAWQTYWYPNATRFIPYTIHEFPSYSFVVSDIHGHVLDIPLALTAIAILIVIFLDGNIFSRFTNLIFAGLAGMMFTTNALDGPIYMGLFTTSHVAWGAIETGYKKGTLISAWLKKVWDKLPWRVWVAAVVVFVAATLPFTHHFDSFVSGVGINCPPPGLAYSESDGTEGFRKIGPLLFEGVGKCQKSPVWMLFVLWGFFAYCGLYAWRLKDQKARRRLFLIWGAYSLGLVLFAEFFYFKDIYPQHFRSNTMFKLGYQAFMLMSLVSGVVITEALAKFKKHTLFILGALPLTYLVMVYPFLSVKSYFGELNNPMNSYKGLAGFNWLEQTYPDDFKAIEWLNTTITWPDQPVVLESSGDSYTDYDRVSMYTGLPTVAGWAVHEWLWRGEYGPFADRAAEVQKVYEGTDEQAAREVLAKYKVKYIFVGDMERKKYPALNEQLIQKLTKVVYHSGETRVYEVL